MADREEERREAPAFLTSEPRSYRSLSDLSPISVLTSSRGLRLPLAPSCGVTNYIATHNKRGHSQRFRCLASSLTLSSRETNIAEVSFPVWVFLGLGW